MSKYTVQVNVPRPTPEKWLYPIGYFPRQFHYQKEAIACAKAALLCGATSTRVECPDGSELDYRRDECQLCGVPMLAADRVAVHLKSERPESTRLVCSCCADRTAKYNQLR